MRKILLTLTLLILIFSCNKEKKKSNGIIIVYNEEEYDKVFKEDKNAKVKVIDTFCINQSKRAEKDIKNNNLTLFCSDVWFEYNEMEELLKKYKIKIHGSERSCIGNGNFDYYCYQDKMWKEIKKRYGENFIDSLWLVAEERFVRKYPDSIYIKDGKDIRSKYLKIK